MEFCVQDNRMILNKPAVTTKGVVLNIKGRAT